jgi:hypothetical protein
VQQSTYSLFVCPVIVMYFIALVRVLVWPSSKNAIIVEGGRGSLEAGKEGRKEGQLRGK